MRFFFGESEQEKQARLNRELFLAVEELKPARVKKLVEAGADIKAMDAHPNPKIRGGVFHVLAQHSPSKMISRVPDKIREICSYLTFKGADINMRDHNGDTMMHVAARHPRYWTDMVASIFTEKHGDIAIVNSRKQTPWHVLCDTGNHQIDTGAGGSWQITGKMISRRDIINARDLDGKTALFYAVRTHSDIAIQKLFEYGADPSICDNAGRTCADEAREHGHIALAGMLEQKIAKLELKKKLTERTAAPSPRPSEPAPEPVAPAAVPVAAPAAVGDGEWLLTGREIVTRVIDQSAVGYRLTQVVDLGNGLLTLIVHNQQTGRDTSETIALGDLEAGRLRMAAHNAFQKLDKAAQNGQEIPKVKVDLPELALKTRKTGIP